MWKNILCAIKLKLNSLFASPKKTSRSILSTAVSNLAARPKGIVLHCAATPKGMDIGFREIDRWHRERGWNGCGYHEIIRLSGEVEKGRSIAPFQEGAHCLGHNDHIGIVWVGGMTDDDKVLHRQFKALNKRIVLHMNTYGFTLDDVYPHNAFTNKACPRLEMEALKKHIRKEWVV